MKMYLFLSVLLSLSAFSADLNLIVGLRKEKGVGINFKIDNRQVCNKEKIKVMEVFRCNFKVAPGEHTYEIAISSDRKNHVYYWSVDDKPQSAEALYSTWFYGADNFDGIFGNPYGEDIQKGEVFKHSWKFQVK